MGLEITNCILLFYNCIEGDQIIDFDISGLDTEARPISLIFGQINNIVAYLNRKFII